MFTEEEQWLLKEKYAGVKNEEFYQDILQLKAGKPLAYIIGHIPFLNCHISLSSQPLIPRSETEYWISKLIPYIQSKNSSPTIKILDLCAGSGCIGIALAKNLATAQIDFIELDPSHLPTIKQNCELNLIARERYSIFSSDLFSALTEQKYDFIVSNPPYIDPTLDRTETSVRTYEPELALYGGKGGTELIEKIIKEAVPFLIPQGELWIEHEPEQILEIQNLTVKNFTLSTFNDQYDIPRYSQLVLK